VQTMLTVLTQCMVRPRGSCAAAACTSRSIHGRSAYPAERLVIAGHLEGQGLHDRIDDVVVSALREAQQLGLDVSPKLHSLRKPHEATLKLVLLHVGPANLVMLNRNWLDSREVCLSKFLC